MINSTKNEKVKYIKRLQQKARFRKKEGLFVVEGIRLCMEAPASMLDSVYISEALEKSGDPDSWLNEASTSGIPITVLRNDVFSDISDVVSPQGVLALVRRAGDSASADGDYILKLLNPAGAKPLLLFLEGLQDPGNMGTILRTAEAAGASGVVACGCVDIYSPKVVRSTMGSIFRLPIACVGDICEAMREAKSCGMSLYGAMLGEDSVSYEKVDFSDSCGILIGNEGAGLSAGALRLCDAGIMIPMQGRVESLNAGMAAGFLLFEAARQTRIK